MSPGRTRSVWSGCSQGTFFRTNIVTAYCSFLRLCSHSLRASSPRCSCGLAGKGRRACILWNLNSTSNFPVAPRRLSCRISNNQGEAGTSANINIKKHVPRVMTSLLMSFPLISISASMQIFKFQRRSCQLSFLFPPRRQSAPESLLAG